jgi:uncharacterized metal-binding protein YceD (DUF177 family)
MPSEGRDLRLKAAEEEREAIAARLGISAVERLEVRLHADRFKGGMRVAGQLEAAIVQPSVISLEPVRQEISEALDRVFLPAGDKAFAGPAGAETFVDLEGEDVPDHFEGLEADLSDLIVETLSLAIDPYPRADGESVEDLGIENDDDDDSSPFSRLRALSKDDPGS